MKNFKSVNNVNTYILSKGVFKRDYKNNISNLAYTLKGALLDFDVYFENLSTYNSPLYPSRSLGYILKTLNFCDLDIDIYFDVFLRGGLITDYNIDYEISTNIEGEGFFEGFSEKELKSILLECFKENNCNELLLPKLEKQIKEVIEETKDELDYAFCNLFTTLRNWNGLFKNKTKWYSKSN